MVKNPDQFCLGCDNIFKNETSSKYGCLRRQTIHTVRKGLRIYLAEQLNNQKATEQSCSLYQNNQRK